MLDRFSDSPVAVCCQGIVLSRPGIVDLYSRAAPPPRNPFYAVGCFAPRLVDQLGIPLCLGAGGLPTY